MSQLHFHCIPGPIARVLVVNENPLIHWSLEQMLRREGYEVFTADSAEKALQEAQATRCEVAIVDVVWREIDGLELIGSLRSVCPDIKPLVITNLASLTEERRALEHGAFAYVEKPFCVREIVSLVKTVLPPPGLA